MVAGAVRWFRGNSDFSRQIRPMKFTSRSTVHGVLPMPRPKRQTSSTKVTLRLDSVAARRLAVASAHTGRTKADLVGELISAAYSGWHVRAGQAVPVAPRNPEMHDVTQS